MKRHTFKTHSGVTVDSTTGYQFHYTCIKHLSRAYVKGQFTYIINNVTYTCTEFPELTADTLKKLKKLVTIMKQYQ